MGNKIKLYHGTSRENAESILLNGFNKQDYVWDCSFDNNIYFYYNDKDEDDKCYLYDVTGNAQICAAINNSKYDEIAVIELELEEGLLDEDYSCTNAPTNSVCINYDELNSYIVNNKVKITVKLYEYYSSLRLFYLVGIRNNRLMDFSNLSEMEYKALNILCFNKNDGTLSDICDVNYVSDLTTDFIPEWKEYK